VSFAFGFWNEICLSWPFAFGIKVSIYVEAWTFVFIIRVSIYVEAWTFVFIIRVSIYVDTWALVFGMRFWVCNTLFLKWSFEFMNFAFGIKV